MQKGNSRSCNASGGPDERRQDRLESRATKPKGRMNQPRGSSKHNTAPGKGKKLKKGVTDFGDDVEF